ncbi:MAG: hypothetical protein BBJ57_04860 [Desulfobacterales bacterium PC51MH44]|nr:MAG: hypothetical protein BBJ57_04860 [Desulfobacterales bacterium PC51MH44]
MQQHINSRPFLFVGNGSRKNLGCEAIECGTKQILRAAFGPCKFVSVDFGGDFRPDEPDIDIIHKSLNVRRFTLSWWSRHLLRAIGCGVWFPAIGKYMSEARAVLALGGDNYSMDYGSLGVHLDLLDYVTERGKPFIIWGGSVGKFDKKGGVYREIVAQKLRKATLILARESVTTEYLSQIGVECNVVRVADPAFVMEPSKPQNLPFDILTEAIGFNFSPLMARFVTGGDLQAAQSLVTEVVRDIIKTTDRPLVFVPHVFRPGNNDYIFLRGSYDILQKEGYPVQLLPDTLTAAEVKWIVGHFTAFAGARMHSTIAAISSGTPTLSFTYSIKSIGINRDVFGSERYVIHPRKISKSFVAQQMASLIREKKDVRSLLADRLPHIRKLAFSAGDHLAKSLAGSS